MKALAVDANGPVAQPDVEIGINRLGAIGGQKRVQGVNPGSTTARRDTPMYADLHLQGGMNLDGLVSRTISLREGHDVDESLKGGTLNRAVVTSFWSHIEDGESR
jgi:S-(hydroxymethyl)glutathione dehydrogenase/alcohol dehydrogenase